jgi:hypothetical protein
MPYTNVNNLAPLVTPAEVITESITNLNFDTTLISENIVKLAEISHIEKPLSREFYEELVTQHAGGTLTVANTTLFDDYLKRTLCWFVKFELMNDIQHNTTSSGIVTNIDDFSESVTPQQYDLMKKDVYRKANIFLQDMLDYLNDSVVITSYPLYQKYGEGSIINNDSTNKKAGIIFY